MLPRAIMEHGVGGQIRRLTLFHNLDRSPDSGSSRQLITASTKYGLTTGSYAAEHLSMTPDAMVLLGDGQSEREKRQKSFDLSIAQFDVFQNLYDRLKNKRLPGGTVLKDEVEAAGISKEDSNVVADVFVANARHLGLVGEVSGTDRILPVEQVLEGLSTTPRVLSSPDGAKQVAQTAERAAPAEETPVRTGQSTGPSIHIDVQVHIDSNASAEQIDQIFTSMARHLYRPEG